MEKLYLRMLLLEMNVVIFLFVIKIKEHFNYVHACWKAFITLVYFEVDPFIMISNYIKTREITINDKTSFIYAV